MDEFKPDCVFCVNWVKANSSCKINISEADLFYIDFEKDKKMYFISNKLNPTYICCEKFKMRY